MTVAESQRAIALLTAHPGCVDWKRIHDRQWELQPHRDLKAEADSLALVLTSMPKYGVEHALFAKSISAHIGNKWNTYDWISKSLSRVLCSYKTYSELWEAINKSLQNGAWIRLGNDDLDEAS